MIQRGKSGAELNPRILIKDLYLNMKILFAALLPANTQIETARHSNIRRGASRDGTAERPKGALRSIVFADKGRSFD